MQNTHRTWLRTLLAILAISLASCGGGGGGGVAPPAALAYATGVKAAVGSALAPLMPTVTGTATAFSVSPALPAGLSLDATTGKLSGIPSRATAPTTYTITASNAAGRTSFNWQLEIDPAANAGAQQNVSTGRFVTLDASGSATTPGGALAYQWTLRSAPSGSAATLASPRSMQPVFRADTSGSYVIDLVVRDGTLQSAPSTVTITASAAPAFAPPPPPLNAATVATCREIAGPGNFILTADLVATTSGAPCISIHDTNAVVLDCAGHALTEDPSIGAAALAISHVQGLTLQNCAIRARTLQFDYLTDATLVANTVAALPDNVFPATIWLTHGTRVTFTHDAFAGALIEPRYGDSLVISDNAYTMPAGAAYVIGAFVWSFYGIHLRVLDNTMDGRWDGLLGAQYTHNGADDGIVLTDETDADIEHNAIQNVFDTGIEWVGVLRASIVHGNVVANAGNAGFGGWYWQNIIDCAFTQNAVQNAPQMFLIFNYYGIRPAGFDPEHRMPADTGVYLQNNAFDGNVASGGRVPGQSAAYMRILGDPSLGGGTSGAAGERAFTLADFHRAQNVFTNNFFDTTLGPPDFAGPPDPSMVVDGGGNACTVIAGSNVPLACQ